MLTLTTAAATQIQHAAITSGAQDMALRIAARPQADGSVHYGMGFDDAGDSDMKLELEGVAVLIASHCQDLLEDTVLDFVELAPGEFNFIFMDARLAAAPPEPARSSAGGCGSGTCASGGCAGKGAPQ